MLKPIYRTCSPATDRCPIFRIYGHATLDAQERFLAVHPDAEALDPIRVTPDQLASWRSLGRWEDDWHSRQFVESGALLRWPEDSREPRSPSPAEYAGIFAAAIEAESSDAFIRSWANSYNFGGDPYADQPEAVTRFLRQLWIVSDWGISEICYHARITIRELEAITLTPYRTLLRWNAEPEKFSPRDRLLTLSHLGLLPRLE
jgi:hypothetical protein